MNSTPQKGDRALLWIGAFKLGKGLLLVIFATGILACVHRDLQATAGHLVERLHFDADNRYIAAFLNKLGLVNERRIKELGGLTFVYAAIFLTEGTGLLLKRRWAEYLTVVATSSLIPVELFEVCKHFTLIRLAFLGVNVGIVWFLILLLKRQPAPGIEPGASLPAASSD